MLLPMITASHEKLLLALARLHFLTVEQLIRLYYSNSSIPYAHHLMRQLYKIQYVDRFYIARNIRWGSNPLVYTLSHRGVTYLRSLGIDAFQTHHTAVKKHSWLEEVFAINDFLIAATLLPTICHTITLPYALHERTIRHQRSLSVIPDAWLSFRIGETTPACLWLEIDMGTEQQPFFRTKVAAILSFAQSGYEQTFGTKSLTVAIATLGGEKRTHLLLHWIEKELKQCSEKDKADLFRVTALPAGELDPRVLFLADVWYIPYRKHKLIYTATPLFVLDC